MKNETLQRIRDETQRLDELPTAIGSFELNKSDAVDENSVEIFSYDSAARHCKVSAYYDDATHEYKVRIRLGLIEWCRTRFFDSRFEKFCERLRAELETMIGRFDENDFGSNSFIDKLKLNSWEYGKNLPPALNGYELFIKPSNPVEFTNGSHIIVNYVDFEDERDLVIYYNMFSDEFSAEARVDGHIHVLYDFDAKTLNELEEKLNANFNRMLSAR